MLRPFRSSMATDTLSLALRSRNPFRPVQRAGGGRAAERPGPKGYVRDVRYGSLADITARSRHVRFTPYSGHSSAQVGCPKSATSGHSRGADDRLLAVDDAHQKMLRCAKCHGVNPSEGPESCLVQDGLEQPTIERRPQHVPAHSR